MYPNILFNTSLLNLSYQIFTIFQSSYLIYRDFTILFHGHQSSYL
ncbi:hypothetical protein NC652_023280 [Populus alba x Populus x berolinensis]|nr:hypothetical protein NC652_023280 [Populus alba x Populus x berolinensis]